MKTSSLPKPLLTAMTLAVMVGAAPCLHAQWSITTTDTANVITFDAYVPDVFGPSGTFSVTGSGFNPTPSAASPYDSNAWAAVAGASANLALPADGNSLSGSLGFGGTVAAGNVSRGVSPVAGNTAGLQVATDLSNLGTNTNRGLAFRPQGTGTDNATVWLKIQNNTGSTVTQWTIDYTGYYIDIGASATPVSFAYSSDNGATFSSNVSGLGFTTPGTNAVTTPTAADWTSVGIAATTLDVSVANGGYLILRWQMGQDILVNGNAGNRIAIDDISITAVAIPEPSSFAALAGLGILGFTGCRRRR